MNFLEYFINYVEENSQILIILGVILVIIFFTRKWPDKATFNFLISGIRGGKHINKHRNDLAENISSMGDLVQKVTNDQKIKKISMKLEQKRTSQLVKTNPKLVRKIGKSLVSIEREYQKKLKKIKSPKAKEILRLATDKKLDDLMQTIDISSQNTPSFDIVDES